MIDFACKQFDLEEIVKCSFGLTKSEYKLLRYLMNHKKQFTTQELSKVIGLDKSTVQRGVKNLHSKKLVSRGQINQSVGGYIFLYRVKDVDFLRERISDIIDGWAEGAKKEIMRW